MRRLGAEARSFSHTSTASFTTQRLGIPANSATAYWNRNYFTSSSIGSKGREKLGHHKEERDSQLFGTQAPKI